jgi:hypothetical protein
MTYDELSKAERTQAGHLEPYIETVQKFVDENITEGVAMPAKAVYEGLASQVQLSEKDFVASFRTNVKCGRISGIVSAHRWGYRRIGGGRITHAYNSDNGQLEARPEPEPKSDAQSADPVKTVVYLTDSYRLVDLDRYQWVLQKRSGDSWQNRSYWSDLACAFKSVARRMLNDEIKASAETIRDIKDAARVVEESEARLITLYKRGYDAAKQESAEATQDAD